MQRLSVLKGKQRLHIPTYVLNFELENWLDPCAHYLEVSWAAYAGHPFVHPFAPYFLSSQYFVSKEQKLSALTFHLRNLHPINGFFVLDFHKIKKR